MRTLKKTLSLVLAIAIVLGLCTIGAAAAVEDTGYSDAANVTYEKAITVLTKINVIEGYKDGSFKPEASVTRAEAAAMIARMMLGGKEAAEKLPDAEDVSFTDVPASHWAAKYIEFCVTKGIIKGMGDGTFRPSEYVTGTQLAAMLLRALGYGQMGEYEGAGWNMNAVADGLYYGVFADTKEDNFDDNATREETALYVFNTMFLDRVAYTDGTTGYKVQWDWSNSYANFAKSAFNLVDFFAQVMENQATGAVYTVLNNFGLSSAINVNIETPLTLVAHEVHAYVSWDFTEDRANHTTFCEAYYLEDVTTALPSGVSFDEFYRAAVALNKRNANVYFSQFQQWVNYVPQYSAYEYYNGNTRTITTDTQIKITDILIGEEKIDGDLAANLHITFDITESGNYVTATYAKGANPVRDRDYFDRLVYYYRIGELKGQESSRDVISGQYLLDYNGLPLAYLTTDYYVGQVKDIDTRYDEVEIYVQGLGTDTYDLALAYEGIAKKDYVTVQPVGQLFYIGPTTTKTATITQRGIYIMPVYDEFGNLVYDEEGNLKYTETNTSFNRMQFYLYHGYGIPVEDSDDPGDVNVGDTVKFYVSQEIFGGVMNDCFALQIIDKAELYGVVYLNYAARTATHGEWDDGTKDSPEKTTPVYKVQCISADGKELVYKVKEEVFNELVDDDGVTLEGVYYVYVDAKGYASFEVVGENGSTEDRKFTKTVGRNSYLRSGAETYLVTDDTVVVYFTGKGDDLDITVASRLSDNEDKTPYTVYAVYRGKSSPYKLQTVWAPEQKPMGNYADSYIFVFEDHADPDEDGDYVITPSGIGDNKEIPYYTVWMDGEEVEIRVKPDASSGFFKGYRNYSLKFGFYSYDYDEEEDVYYLKEVEASRRVTLRKGGTSFLQKVGEKVTLTTYDCDGRTITAEIKDVAGETTIGTRKDTNINDALRLYELFDEGYRITIEYVYTAVSFDNVPVGVIYVTNVYRP